MANLQIYITADCASAVFIASGLILVPTKFNQQPEPGQSVSPAQSLFLRKLLYVPVPNHSYQQNDAGSCTYLAAPSLWLVSGVVGLFFWCGAFFQNAQVGNSPIGWKKLEVIF